MPAPKFAKVVPQGLIDQLKDYAVNKKVLQPPVPPLNERTSPCNHEDHKTCRYVVDKKGPNNDPLPCDHQRQAVKAYEAL